MDLSAAPGTAPLGAPAFIVYVTAVLTVAMVLFPPFVSLNGTEYAFVLTGPEWSRAMGSFGEEMGLSARIHWEALSVQLGALWAIGLGARWFLTDRGSGRRGGTPPSKAGAS